LAAKKIVLPGKMVINIDKPSNLSEFGSSIAFPSCSGHVPIVFPSFPLPEQVPHRIPLSSPDLELDSSVPLGAVEGPDVLRPAVWQDSMVSQMLINVLCNMVQLPHQMA
jgi:hypothetical protein